MLAFLGSALCVIFSWYFYKSWRFGKYFENLKSPPRHPFIGHAIKLGFTPSAFLRSVMQWTKDYNNDMYHLWLGPNPYILLTDPKQVEVIMSSTSILKKTDVYQFLIPWLHQGLLTSDGAKWHSRRKMITPSFHFKILVDFLESMNDCSDKFIEKLAETSQKEGVFDIQQMVQYFALDVICETAMGIKINAMDNADSEIACAFREICYTMQNRMLSVLKRSDFLYRFTWEYYRQRKALKFLNAFTAKVIGSRKKLHCKHVEKPNQQDDHVARRHAFLDTLLEAQVNGMPLSDADIDEEVSTFMFEGHDTTASGITFATYILSRHPEIQQKAYEEQETIFGKDKTQRPTFQQIQDMKYLEMVIKESLRLYPSVPIIGRYTEENVVIDGHLIPPNTGILINIIGMGYNEKYHENPTKVDPERFDVDRRQKGNPYDYIPFSAGPRNCIGQKFAMLEMKSVLSKIVRNFEILPPVNGLSANGYYDDISRCSEYYPIPSTVLTLKSDNGVKIKLRERNT